MGAAMQFHVGCGIELGEGLSEGFFSDLRQRRGVGW